MPRSLAGMTPSNETPSPRLNRSVGESALSDIEVRIRPRRTVRQLESPMGEYMRVGPTARKEEGRWRNHTARVRTKEGARDRVCRRPLVYWRWDCATEASMNEPESLDEFAARMGVFMKNRAVFPEEELMKYAGQWIAWSPDGTAIVAHSAESDTAVYDTLKANGYDIG